MLNDIAAYVNAGEGVDFAATPFTPARGVQLVELLAADEISSKQAKEVFAAVLEEDKDPQAIVEERGMKQVSDTGAIEAVVDAVLAANPAQVEQYRSGKKGVRFFLRKKAGRDRNKKGVRRTVRFGARFRLEGLSSGLFPENIAFPERIRAVFPERCEEREQNSGREQEKCLSDRSVHQVLFHLEGPLTFLD